MQIICKLLIMYASMQKCGFGPLASFKQALLEEEGWSFFPTSQEG